MTGERATPAGRIIIGDAAQTMDRLDQGTADMIFADPPYNLQLRGQLIPPNNTRAEGVDAGRTQLTAFAATDDHTRR